MPRRPLFVACLVAVAALDVARSLHVRSILRQQQAQDTGVAAPLPVAADELAGAQVYRAQCARCHGPDGKGDGPAAAGLHPRPRDFTRGTFKLKSTGSGEAPTRSDIRATIQNGMAGTSMPAFDDVLSAAQIDLVAEYLRGFGPHSAWSAEDRSVAVPEEVGSAEEGAKRFVELGCPACHGKDGRGDGAAASALRDVWLQPAPPRDLTAPWTFRAGATKAALYKTIARGLGGTPMPGYLEGSGRREVLDVVAYVQSIARQPPWDPAGSLEDVKHDDPVKRGAYLVRSGMCALCHAHTDGAGGPPTLAGGGRIDAAAHGVFFASNLTSDGDSGIGNRKVEEIALAMQSGHTRRGRLSFLAMPWIVYGSWAADDALAVARYLKTLPPVRNFVPAALHYGFVETVVRKVGYGWPGAVPERVVYDVRNFGSEQTTAGAAARTHSTLIWMQLGLLFVGLISLFRVSAHDAEVARSSAVLVASVVGALVASTAALVIYWYPALNALPARSMVEGFVAAVPSVDRAGRDAHAVALLERGRYIYVTSSCAYCHNGNGAGGGRVDGAFGHVWTANLTSHESGLATRSDEVILRALISGLDSRQGSIDPRVMPWNSYSNLSADDQHALLAFLRSLPAVANQIPAPVATDGGDRRGVTFWTGSPE